VKAKQYMLKPFFVEGYLVEEDNMDEIAEWCQGVVIRTNDKPFIRVPVVNARTPRHSEARTGMYVLKSMDGRDTFTIYTASLLEKKFVEIPGINTEEKPAVLRETVDTTTAKVLPMQRTPSPAIFAGRTSGR
jgi:hypothetical protein